MRNKTHKLFYMQYRLRAFEGALGAGEIQNKISQKNTSRFHIQIPAINGS